MSHQAAIMSNEPAILASARRCGAPRGNRNGWKHGLRSAWLRDVRYYLRATSPAATARWAKAALAEAGTGEKYKNEHATPCTRNFGVKTPSPAPGRATIAHRPRRQATASHIQPRIIATPPNGVTIPNRPGAPKAIA